MSEAKPGMASALILLAIVRTFVDAWAVLTLWRWFVLPLGAPDINFWHAAGLDVFVSLFFLFAARKSTSSQEDEFNFACGKVLSVVFAVGIGWLLHLGVR